MTAFVTPVMEQEITQWVHQEEIDLTTHHNMSRCSSTELHLAPKNIVLSELLNK